MLVLTREVGQRLVLGEAEIFITVLEVRGNQVRIGIQAPFHVAINREEIYLKKLGHKETKNDSIIESQDSNEKSSS